MRTMALTNELNVKKDESSTRRQGKESEVDEVFETLVSRHSDRYNRPQLRLWARMVCSNIREDSDNPPNIPAFSGKTNRKSQPESISDAIGRLFSNDEQACATVRSV